MICAHCHEPILPGEYWGDPKRSMHHECLFRGILGSLAHINKTCSCYVPGSTEGDPPDMTPRQAARAALARHLELNGI